MAHATRDEVLRALDQVIDPVSGRSVVQQDIIQGLVLRDGNVGFAVEVDPRRGREAEPLRRACRA
jgi:ATP-binding protein involved in chromosome partitioning